MRTQMFDVSIKSPDNHGWNSIANEVWLMNLPTIQAAEAIAKNASLALGVSSAMVYSLYTSNITGNRENRTYVKGKVFCQSIGYDRIRKETEI